ncbi:MAG: putative porin [Janthinobacterium sp.]|jgi:predicted porin
MRYRQLALCFTGADAASRRRLHFSKTFSNKFIRRQVMKKTLITLATLSALAGTVQAQSNVTVYGQVDAGLRNLTNVDAAGDSQLSMSSGGTYHSNRFGFKGSEDLGNGLKAIFQLEGGFNSGTGVGNKGLFDRTAKVGISGAYGTVSLGRQYTVAFDTISAYDPMSYKYSGITLVMAATMGVRDSNIVKYEGKFGAFTARAGYAAGEQTGGTSNGAKQAIGLSYDNGPISLGGAYTQKKANDGLGGDLEHYTMGGTYQIGAVKMSAGYADQTLTVVGASDTSDKYAWVGAAYQFSPVLDLRTAYYQVKNSTANADGKKDVFIVSSVYSLSKRTVLYAEIDNSKVSGATRFVDINNKDMINSNKKQLGVSAGMVHYF